MTRHLTQEWIDLEQDAMSGLPEVPGCTVHVRYVVTGAADGDVRYEHRWEDGRLTSGSLGDGDAEPDVVLTVPHDVAVALLDGQLGLNAAYMQGRVKLPDTRSGPLLQLLARTSTDEYRRAQAEVAAATER